MGALNRLLAPLAVVLLAGCSSYSVKYDFDPTAGFRSYRTFDWYASSKKAQGKKAEANPLTEKRVRASVEQQLQAKGYLREAKADPDFLIAYYPIYQTRRYRTTTSVGVAGGGWHRPWGYGVGTRFSTSQTHSYKEGTIVLEIVDYKTNQLVWQASAEGALSPHDDPQEAQEQIDRAVRDLLERFPPK
jgi:hypothetical protein